ncbi:MAG: RAMP superfamily CRISPR-associated protein [Gammaproteobacteria bacterium]|nr:RAMP superfamily CRISPR-associated protein [Gammaproteobacteria bacterium]
MQNLKIYIDIKSYWHAGTGRSQGALVDSLTQKNKLAGINGDELSLPYLPGKTIRGLLRDSVHRLEEWGHLKEFFIKDSEISVCEALFGAYKNGASRHNSISGLLSVSDGKLPTELTQWLSQNPGYSQALYTYIQSTAISPDTGVAKEKSLRTTEVCMPVKLTSEVQICSIAIHTLQSHLLDENRWVDILKKALPLIRAIGSHRSRGLGRAFLTAEEVNA